uniref:MAP2B n=1 Tax=Arundo donax TaxID=35708 RepID=A0A0A9HAD8_ARUDO
MHYLNEHLYTCNFPRVFCLIVETRDSLRKCGMFIYVPFFLYYWFLLVNYSVLASP